MDLETLKRLAEDPDLISGIYNYCDRWCARCAFTVRCLSYRADAEAAAEPGDGGPGEPDLAADLTESLTHATALLEEIAEEEGIDLTTLPEEPEEAEEPEAPEEAVGSVDLEEVERFVRGALDYAQEVDAWFGKNRVALEEKAEALTRAARADLPGTDPAKDGLEIRDALEVIRWYQHFIYFKLARAVTGLAEEPDPVGATPASDDATYDSNGSAKVALIAMDRSLDAWTSIRKHFDELEDSTLDSLARLARLRDDAETRFPRARAFQRPGFDTEGGANR